MVFFTAVILICCSSQNRLGDFFDTDICLIFTCQKPRQKDILECEKKKGKYKEGMERNRKGKMLHEIHVIKKSAKRTYPNLGITIGI